LQSSPVEPDDDLSVDHRHRSRPGAEPQDLGERGRLLADILDLERNSLLRKKLFLSIAARSARLGVDSDFFRH